MQYSICNNFCCDPTRDKRNHCLISNQLCILSKASGDYNEGGLSSLKLQSPQAKTPLLTSGVKPLLQVYHHHHHHVFFLLLIHFTFGNTSKSSIWNNRDNGNTPPKPNHTLTHTYKNQLQNLTRSIFRSGDRFHVNNQVEADDVWEAGVVLVVEAVVSVAQRRAKKASWDWVS